MIMTMTRTPAGDVTVPAIAKVNHADATLAGSGGTLVRNVSMSDLFAREAIEGDPSWKILDQLVKDGTVTSIAFTADPVDVDVLDEANEV